MLSPGNPVSPRETLLTAVISGLATIQPGSRNSTFNPSRSVRWPVNRPIAAHFHSVDLEFAYFGEDLGEPVCEAVEARVGIAVWERSAQNQHEILCDE
jgi:hypothetical protein